MQNKTKKLEPFRRYLYPFRRSIAATYLLIIVESAIFLLSPILYGRVIDLTMEEKALTGGILTLLSIWLLAKLTGDWLGRRIGIRANKIALDSSAKVITESLAHLIRLPLRFHKEKKVGELIQRFTRAEERIYDIVEKGMFQVIPDLSTAMIAFFVIGWINWQLALIYLLFIVVFVAATIWKTRPLIRNQKKMNRIFEKVYGDVFDRTPNILNIKSNVAEEEEILNNEKNFGQVVAAVNNHVAMWMRMKSWQDSIFSLSFLALFLFGMILVGRGQATIGQFVVLLSYINMASVATTKLGGHYKQLQEGIVTVNRAYKIFGEEPEGYDDPEALPVSEIKGDVEFRGVSFAYHKENVLRNISFKASAGQMVAIVGKSGEGKSTLVSTISRYLIPQKGKILVDGTDIRRMRLADLRNFIAIVPQEVDLFNDSIRNNIGYSRFGATEEEIIAAAKVAHCHEFIEKFPKKYKQMVGERGVKLSTGQKQRLAIARAVLRDPRILILDEATSALDSQSEKYIQEALVEVMNGRTTFVIAHRLSTIRRADLILVLEGGEIVESGTHEELVRHGGVYQKLSELQKISY